MNRIWAVVSVVAAFWVGAGARRYFDPHGAMVAGLEPPLAPVLWLPAGPGLEWSRLSVESNGGGPAVTLVLVRLDPALHTLRLEERYRDHGLRADWTVDRAAAGAVFALNAGQFVGSEPWGWLVRSGREIQPPGDGPLVTAIVGDTSGGIHWLGPDQWPVWRRERMAETAWAFQSYPTLLEQGGVAPAAFTAEPGAAATLDLSHRDGRLALGRLPDGRLLIVLTRYAGMGEPGGSLPFGLTVVELAGLMQRLGAERAVALDGGISAQLMLREAGGAKHAWRGWRPVPLGLVGEERGKR